MASDASPKISIGLPVYNGEKYLPQAIDAILAQDFRRFELVLSDNCSTDDTAEICRRYAARDDRVRYLRNARNLGAAANFNRVVELARGTCFAWANHDDLWAPEFLSHTLAALEARPDAVLAYARAAKIDARGAVVAPLIQELGLDAPRAHARLRRFHDHFRALDREAGAWSRHDIEGLWTPVYGLIRLEELRRTGLIGAYIASDTILLEELLLRGAFVEVPETLFFKRDHVGRSMRASVSYQDRVNWFTGKRAGTLIFPRWRMLAERMRAAGRVGSTPIQRLGGRAEMLRFYVRRPHEGRALVKEVLINAGRLAAPLMARLGVASRSAPEKW